jgi:hypothetical protein
MRRVRSFVLPVEVAGFALSVAGFAAMFYTRSWWFVGLARIGSLTIILGLAGIALTRPPRSRWGSWAHMVAAMTAVSLVTVAIVKLYNANGIEAFVSAQPWAAEAWVAAFAALALALTARRVRFAVWKGSLIACAALAVAALAYSIWLRTPRGSVWNEIAIAAALLSAAFALRATAD